VGAVSTRWCPQCGAEYVEGVDACADCACALVDEQPQHLAEPHHRSIYNFAGQFGPDDDVVELCRIPSEFQAEVIAARLRDMGIPASLINQGQHLTTHLQISQGSRLFIRREDAERAAGVVNDTYSDTPLEAPFDQIELARLAEESAEPEGWVDPDTGAVV
jgi:hypothetical protein